MDQTEYSLNISKIESLMPEQKTLFRNLIETTVNLIDNSNRSKPELTNLVKALPGGDKLVQERWHAMVAAQIIDIWKGVGTPTHAQEFEEMINSPNKKMAGFHLRGSEYPIFPPNMLKQENLLVIGEPEVRNIYISLGGSEENATKMFPAEKNTK
jgi:hypothetical protein